MTDHDIIKAAEALDFPTNDAFAASLWRLSHDRSYSAGADLLRACGYIPFVGFPLVRSGKFRAMTRDEVEHELDNNPLCNLTHEINF